MRLWIHQLRHQRVMALISFLLKFYTSGWFLAVISDFVGREIEGYAVSLLKSLSLLGCLSKDLVENSVSQFWDISFVYLCLYCMMMQWGLMTLLWMYLTSRASDKCQREKRKTINGEDLLWAMATLGFEDYIEPLKLYLTRYREVCSTLHLIRFPFETKWEFLILLCIKRIPQFIHSLALCILFLFINLLC